MGFYLQAGDPDWIFSRVRTNWDWLRATLEKIKNARKLKRSSKEVKWGAEQEKNYRKNKLQKYSTNELEKQIHEFYSLA